MDKTSGWRWVPSLYVFQGVPSCLVMTTSALLFKDMGVSIESFAFWTSLICLPWSLKPLWAPIVERVSTKRKWVLVTEVLLSLALVILGYSLVDDNFYAMALIAMGVIAFLSASHDIACDGYYMLALSEKEQSFFVGIRSTFYRVAMVLTTGGIPFLAGNLQKTMTIAQSWAVSITLAGLLLALLALLNKRGMPKIVEPEIRQDNGFLILWRAFRSFFTHPGVVPAITFFLVYRLGEALLSKVVAPFLIDSRDAGGIGLTVAQSGVVYGTFGVVALVVGGILGGWLASRYSLKRVMWPMVLMMNIPNLAYVAMAHFQPMADSLWVTVAIMTEQFGYGFGFSAYTLYMLRYVSDAEYKAAEYSLCTAFMSLSMILPGMAAGWVLDAVGSYEAFFGGAGLATIPGMVTVAFLIK